MKKNFFISVICSFILMSCAAEVQQHGNKPDTFLLEQIKIGQTSKPEVFSLLGSPSSVTMFEEEAWLYISSKRKQVAFFNPDELEREVVAITFNSKTDKVSNIFFAQKEDGVPVVISSKETPTSGHSMTVFEQMFSNVGRFEGK